MVQYGADIHAVEMGSGFPTKGTEDLLPEDEVTFLALYEELNGNRSGCVWGGGIDLGVYELLLICSW